VISAARVLAAAAVAFGTIGCPMPPDLGPMPPIHSSHGTTTTATVEAIDRGERMVTLKGENGRTVTVHVPDTLGDFERLKVGDRVRAHYLELKVISMQSPDPSKDGSVKWERQPGEDRAVNASRERSEEVTIESIDPALPSLVVISAKGARTIDLRPEDRSMVEKLHVGDRILLTYSEALMLEVESTPP
jgi:hypothetical protein